MFSKTVETVSEIISGPAPANSIETLNAILDGKEPIQVIVLGNHNVGKSSLLSEAKKNEDATYSVDIPFKGNSLHAIVHLTTDTVPKNTLRQLVYPDSHLAVVTFAVDDWVSLSHVSSKWKQEAEYYRPGLPLLLCACKIDLRNDPEVAQQLKKKGLMTISTETGALLSEDSHCLSYFEIEKGTGTQSLSKALETVLLEFEKQVRPVEEPVVEKTEPEQGFFGSLWSAGESYWKKL